MKSITPNMNSNLTETDRLLNDVKPEDDAQPKEVTKKTLEVMAPCDSTENLLDAMEDSYQGVGYVIDELIKVRNEYKEKIEELVGADEETIKKMTASVPVLGGMALNAFCTLCAIVDKSVSCCMPCVCDTSELDDDLAEILAQKLALEKKLDEYISSSVRPPLIRIQSVDECDGFCESPKDFKELLTESIREQTIIRRRLRYVAEDRINNPRVGSFQTAMTKIRFINSMKELKNKTPLKT